MPDNSSYVVVPLSVLWLVILAAVVVVIVLVTMKSRARKGSRLVEVEPARGPLPEFDKDGKSAVASLVQWSPETLRHILATELPDAQVIVVSNREPYIHNREGDSIQLVVPASGLVSALEPITRACAGTWIAYGGGSADALVVDKNDRIEVPPDNPSYTLRRVWLSEEEQQGYYLGFANGGLWPLCHITSPGRYSAPRTGLWGSQPGSPDTVVAKPQRAHDAGQDYHFARCRA